MTSGQNTVQPVPSSRFVGQFYGHFLLCAEMFDGAFFAMGLSEVRATDPSHRLLLESAFGAIVDSELQLSAPRLSVGVYLGFCNAMNWANVMAEQAAGSSVCCVSCICVTKPAFCQAFSAHGCDSASAAGRVSYLFGLKGPCCSINTACSSSLVALDTGFANISLHKCQHALVAGVNLQLHCASWVALGTLNALAPDGQCKTFDASADGFGRAEAVGAVVFTANSAQGVLLLATAVNQDGR